MKITKRKVSNKMILANRKRMLGKKRSEETKLKIGLGNSREKSSCWKGGRIKVRGYIFVLEKSHPFCGKSGYIAEHRLVMEKHLDRYLEPSEIVHHINGVRNDNRVENLMLFKNVGEHRKFHIDFDRKHGIYRKPRVPYEIVCKIREEYSFRKNTLSMLSKKYNVSVWFISNVINMHKRIDS